MNKAFIHISKTIKFKILSHSACTAFASAWFLATFEKCKLQTYRCWCLGGDGPADCIGLSTLYALTCTWLQILRCMQVGRATAAAKLQLCLLQLSSRLIKPYHFLARLKKGRARAWQEKGPSLVTFNWISTDQLDSTTQSWLVIWGKPERAPYWSNGVPRDLAIYLSYVIP